MGLGGDFMFSVFPIIFMVVFALVVGVIVFALVAAARTAVKNRNSPMLTVAARVVTKRSDVSGGSGDSAAHTWHHATFEVESGDRLELPVTGEQYGMLAEGDVGRLTFQGTRFLGFERQPQNS